MVEGLAREIRHAVYFTGGLVLLAFGVLESSGGLAQVLGCALQTSYCPGPLSNALIVEIAPGVVGAALLVVFGVVLLLRARRTIASEGRNR